MFSGLVEQTAPVLELTKDNRLILKRPSSFTDLTEGESVAVDGACLTLESFTEQTMTFALGVETLKITNWQAEKLKQKKMNLERSLTLKSLVGGQILTGHVDDLAQLKQIVKQDENFIWKVEIPKEYTKFFWKKGYIALNGVSLTVNKMKAQILEVCLIPKTLKLTNLSENKIGDSLNFEVDYLSRPGVEAVYKLLQRELRLYGLLFGCAVFLLFLALFFNI